MKLLLVLVALGLVVYAGFLLSKLNKVFHKHVVAFVRQYRVILIVLALVIVGTLTYVAYYTSAFDSHCRNWNVSTAPPPVSNMTPTDYLLQGDNNFDKGNCMQAIVDYSQAIVRDLSFASAYNNRAYAYMRMRNYAFAARDLDHALELRPNYVNALMNQGDLYNYYYQINKERAIADYDRVIATGQTDAANSVCGHRARAIYQLRGQIGWNIISYIQLMFSPRDFGCTIPAP